MERRRCPNRKAQMEMVLASIFLASRGLHNVCSLSEVELEFPPYTPKTDNFVNGPKASFVSPLQAIPPQDRVVEPIDGGANDLRVLEGEAVPQKIEAFKFSLSQTDSGDLAHEVPNSNSLDDGGRISVRNLSAYKISPFRNKSIVPATELLLALMYAAVDRLQRDVVSYLERAEEVEADTWLRDDLRVAQLVVLFADKDKPDPYASAFIQTFNIHPSKVVSWWRDRKKLYRLCELGGSNTPLLHVNLASELERPELIPDYDYSQVSSGGAHAERSSGAYSPVMSRDDGNSGPQNPEGDTGTVSQSGPLERVSPVPPTPRHPAKKPAAPATTSSGDRGAGSHKGRMA